MAPFRAADLVAKTRNPTNRLQEPISRSQTSKRTARTCVNTPESIATREAAAEAFLAEHGPHWTVRLSDETGTPLSIFVETPPTGIFEGQTSIAIPGETPEARAIRFFERYSTPFGIDGEPTAVLAITTVVERGEQIHVRLQQVHNTVPVHTADYNLTFGQDGGLRMVSGKYFPEIDLDATPSILPTTAIQTALDEIGENDLLGGLLDDPVTKLVVLPMEDSYELAFKVSIEQSDPPGMGGVCRR